MKDDKKLSTWMSYDTVVKPTNVFLILHYIILVSKNDLKCVDGDVKLSPTHSLSRSLTHYIISLVACTTLLGVIIFQLGRKWPVTINNYHIQRSTRTRVILNWYICPIWTVYSKTLLAALCHRIFCHNDLFSRGYTILQ